MANQASTINTTHLVDTLLACGVAVQKLLAPEHGFRGMGNAGEWIADSVDKHWVGCYFFVPKR